MAEKKDYTTVEHKKPYRYEEDGLHVTRGCGWSAPGCHLGCGVLLYTDDDGKLVKVEGDPENPFNQGRLCVRCLDLPEVVYSPDRILHPLKRDPENRGKNQWEQIAGTRRSTRSPGRSSLSRPNLARAPWRSLPLQAISRARSRARTADFPLL